MSMTIWNMSEQTRNSITEVIGKFYSAFYSRIGFRNEYPIIGLIASLLYLMKKGYISLQTNIPKETNGIISMMDLSYMEITSKRHFEEWESQGIYNKAIVAEYPETDPMAEIITQNLSFLDRFSGEPVYIFEFVQTILKSQEGNLYFLQVLDIALYKFSSNHSAGQFSQPVEFAELASALVDSKNKNIYNPFSGLMSFATSMKEYASFTGVEKDSFIAEISKFRMFLADIQDKVSCIQGDVTEWANQSYDIILSNPPLGAPISVNDDSRPIRSEWFCLKNFESQTNGNGVLFTFVVPSVLFETTRAKEIRRELTERNYLDTVISLPANLLRPYTSISLVALLLRKDREKDAPIKMLDATEFNKGDKKKPVLDVDAVVRCLNNPSPDKCVCITQDDIRQRDYTWSVEKYLNPIRESFPEGYEVVSLGDVVELIRGERHFEENSGHLAQIAELASGGEDCIRTVDSFETSNDLSHATKITEPVILLSSIRLLKPTYCEASSENPIFLQPNLWACRITQNWISPTYLCLELSRRFVPTTGNVIPRISRADLLGMKIAFPSVGQQRSFEEQNNLYKEAAYNAKLSKAKEMGLQEVIDKMKDDYINVIRARKHDMRPYIRELGSFERMMRQYIRDVEESNLASKMTSLLDQHKISLDKLKDLVDIFSEEQQFGETEYFNINEYFVDLEINHDEKTGYWIEYDRDDNALSEIIPIPYGEPRDKNFMPLDHNSVEYKMAIEEMYKFPIVVDINHVDFERLVRNIIENAVTHGFTDSNRKDYGIGIDLTIDMNKEMFQIDFSNNGTPLPTGMDKQRYGILGEKAGTTGGTGRGGYIVKSIVEHYHGDYDVFMDGENTVIRILLPISNYDYEYEFAEDI